MRQRVGLALALALAVSLAIVAPANAEWFMTKRKAEIRAERAAELRYGSATYGAFCRPQGARAPTPGYVYHRWVCTWTDTYDCVGQLIVLGSRGVGTYYTQVLSGQRCPTGVLGARVHLTAHDERRSGTVTESPASRAATATPRPPAPRE